MKSKTMRIVLGLCAAWLALGHPNAGAAAATTGTQAMGQNEIREYRKAAAGLAREIEVWRAGWPAYGKFLKLYQKTIVPWLVAGEEARCQMVLESGKPPSEQVRPKLDMAKVKQEITGVMSSLYRDVYQEFDKIQRSGMVKLGPNEERLYLNASAVIKTHAGATSDPVHFKIPYPSSSAEHRVYVRELGVAAGDGMVPLTQFIKYLPPDLQAKKETLEKRHEALARQYPQAMKGVPKFSDPYWAELEAGMEQVNRVTKKHEEEIRKLNR